MRAENLRYNPFIADLARSFPPDYRRFPEIDSLTHELYRLPDEVSFAQAHLSTWARYCMELDYPIYHIQMAFLSQELRAHPRSEHPHLINTRLATLASDSAYPIYLREWDKLLQEGYLGATVHSWTRNSYRDYPPKITRELEKIYLYIFNFDLLKRSFNPPGSFHLDSQIEPLLTDFNISQHLGYFGLLHILVGAEARALGQVRDKALLQRHNALGLVEIKRTSPAASIHNLLRKAEPYALLVEELNESLRQYEGEHFPRDNPLVRDLWRAAVDLRSPNYKLKNTARSRLLGKLAGGYYEDAVEIIQKTMIATPSMYPAGLARRLGLDMSWITTQRAPKDEQILKSWKDVRKESRLNILVSRWSRRELRNKDGSVKVEVRLPRGNEQLFTLIIYTGREIINPPHIQQIDHRWIAQMIEDNSLFPAE